MRKPVIPYNIQLRERARELRNNQTKHENKLWYLYLNNLPVQFNRQKPLDNYIVDFYSHQLGLVIEIDGDTHYTSEAMEYDKERTAVLESYGLIVIRFTNDQIEKEFDAVCEKIKRYCKLS